MQYKKNEIKEKIDSAALTVFAEKGYSGATVSDIGREAGVSVGNIYKYYNSKEDIFYANVGEAFVDKAKTLLAEKICASQKQYAGAGDCEDAFWLVNEEVISFMVENRSRMLIVFGKSGGTKYENTKKELVEFIISEVEGRIFKQPGAFAADSPGRFTASVIYSSLIDMVLGVLEELKDPEALRKSLQRINTYHLLGIAGFLMEIENQDQEDFDGYRQKGL